MDTTDLNKKGEGRTSKYLDISLYLLSFQILVVHNIHSLHMHMYMFMSNHIYFLRPCLFLLRLWNEWEVYVYILILLTISFPGQLEPVMFATYVSLLPLLSKYVYDTHTDTDKLRFIVVNYLECFVVWFPRDRSSAYALYHTFMFLLIRV